MDVIQPLARLDRVYCAGPLFNQSERREMQEIAAALESAGFATFVPHAHGMEFANVLPVLVGRGWTPVDAGALLHRAIFALDVYQVAAGCGALVFNLNGRVPDEGGVSEAAIAWSLGKPLVLYKNDVRTAVSARDNPLVAGLTDFEIVDRLAELAPRLRELIAEHPLPEDWSTHCPPRLRAAVAAGESLWVELEAMGAARPNDSVADVVLELFGAVSIQA
jgi:nucleoside 2-deoxyribosyltransferase